MLDVISITDITVELSDGKKPELIFTPVQLSTAFRINTIPQCSCTVLPITDEEAAGYNSGDVYENIRKALDMYNSGTVYITISVCAFRDSDGAGVTKEIFSGIVTSMTSVVNMSSYGSSSAALAISGVHNFARLFNMGSAGMVPIYEDTAVEDIMGNILSNLQKDTQNPTETFNGNDINSILGSKTGAQEKPTSEYIWDTVKLFAGKLDSEKNKNRKPLVGSDLIDTNEPLIVGAAKPAGMWSKSSGDIQPLTDILTGILTISRLSTVGDGILRSITSSGCGLLLAPRDVNTITLIPDYGSLFSTAEVKDIPFIDAEMISSVSVPVTDDPYPNPDGVIVTSTGSATYAQTNPDKKNAQPTGSVIQAVYPKIKDKTTGDIRLVNIPAPNWLANLNPTGKDPEKTKKDACEAYAAMMYGKLKNKNNTVTVNTDIRGILGFQALGETMGFPAWSDSMDPFMGRLDSYGLSYSAATTNGSSHLSVTLTLTYADQVENIEHHVLKQEMCLYDITTMNSLKAFPGLFD